MCSPRTGGGLQPDRAPERARAPVRPPLSRTPVLYDPGIVIVCGAASAATSANAPTCTTPTSTGRLRAGAVHHGNGCVGGIPAARAVPALDFPLAAELMLEIDRHDISTDVAQPQSMMSSPLDAAMQLSTERLLRALADPVESALFGPSCSVSCTTASSPARRLSCARHSPSREGSERLPKRLSASTRTTPNRWMSHGWPKAPA